MKPLRFPRYMKPRKKPVLMYGAQGQVWICLPYWTTAIWFYVGVLALAAIVGVMAGAAVWDLTHWK